MKPLSTEALAVFSTLEILPSEGLVKIPGSKPLARGLYLEVNAGLEALGGIWKRKLKAHQFADDPTGQIQAILAEGGFHDGKRDLQQFFTPPALALQLVSRLQRMRSRAGLNTALEPSAGKGAIASILGQMARRLVCVEKDPGLGNHLQGRVQAADGLHPRLELFVDVGDFLGEDLLYTKRYAPFDSCAMNPPFHGGQDVAHVTRAYRLLAPGGCLVGIMAGGVTFRKDKKTAAFRILLDEASGTVEDLPDGSFSESGTNVKVVMVTMRRPT